MKWFRKAEVPNPEVMTIVKVDKVNRNTPMIPPVPVHVAYRNEVFVVTVVRWTSGDISFCDIVPVGHDLKFKHGDRDLNATIRAIAKFAEDYVIAEKLTEPPQPEKSVKPPIDKRAEFLKRISEPVIPVTSLSRAELAPGDAALSQVGD